MLNYIRKHVTEWPEGANVVWLCSNGKIEFDSDVEFDFYPDEMFEGVFKTAVGHTCSGEEYTREQWEQTDLTKLDKPFGELDRATQLKLVEHVLDGGSVEKYVQHDWVASNLLCHLIAFKSDTKYRAIR